MIWIDVVSIVFVCVTMNHLGLIKAIEEKAECEFHILNCPKCSTMWCTFVYTACAFGISDVPLMLAISFLASYSALWLELLEGYIDTLYLKLYEKIYNSAADAPATDPDNGHSAGSLPKL